MANTKKNRQKNNLTPAKNVKADILVPRLFFMLSVLLLLLFGLVMIFSASSVEALSQDINPYSYVSKQLLFSLVGVGLAVGIWRGIPYSMWDSVLTWIIYILALLAMVGTLVMGVDILGARRWIYIFGISVQPSEFAKIALVLIVAKYYSEYRENIISSRKCILVLVGLIGFTFLFIYKFQSDLGTTIICAVGILTLLWIAGFPLQYFLLLIAILFIFACVAIFGTGYRSDRMVFLNPYGDGQDGRGAGYQLIRSFYAFAQGGFFGLGLGNSYEKYQYLPEAETDFIFAIVGEEMGFLGCLLLLGIFTVFIVSGIFVAFRSKNRFAASVSGAFVTMIGFQAVLNIFCVIGFAPTTGKPLPFISSGGSSVIATLAMVGFVLAGSEADALPDRYDRTRGRFRVNKPLKAKNDTRLNPSKASTSNTQEDDSVKGISFRPSKSSILSIIKNAPIKNNQNKQKPATANMPKLKSRPKKSSPEKDTTTRRQSFVYKREHRDLGFKPQTTNFAPLIDEPKDKNRKRTRQAKRKGR